MTTIKETKQQLKSIHTEVKRLDAEVRRVTKPLATKRNKLWNIHHQLTLNLIEQAFVGSTWKMFDRWGNGGWNGFDLVSEGTADMIKAKEQSFLHGHDQFELRSGYAIIGFFPHRPKTEHAYISFFNYRITKDEARKFMRDRGWVIA